MHSVSIEHPARVVSIYKPLAHINCLPSQFFMASQRVLKSIAILLIIAASVNIAIAAPSIDDTAQNSNISSSDTLKNSPSAQPKNSSGKAKNRKTFKVPARIAQKYPELSGTWIIEGFPETQAERVAERVYIAKNKKI